MKREWRGWMTRAQARLWMKGKLGALLIRESTDPQMLMFGPTMQLRSADRARSDVELSPWAKTYSLAHTGTDIFASQVVQQMVADATAGLFQVLVIAYGSRFARDLSDGMSLLRTLNGLGIAVYFVHEDVLVGFEQGWMKKIGHQLVEAHTFSDERSQSGHENIRERFLGGYAHGRSGFGYTTVGSPRKRLVRDETEVAGRPRWAWRAWMYEQCLSENRSNHQIAMDLNAACVRTGRGGIFTKMAVGNILRDPVSKGEVRYLRNTPDAKSRIDECLRIVSDDVFERAVALLTSRSTRHKSPERERHIHVFEGVARCSECGEPLWYEVRPSGTGLKHPHHLAAPITCRFAPLVCRDRLPMDALGALLAEITLPPDAVALAQGFAAERPVQRETAKLRAKLQARLRNADEMRLDGTMLPDRHREVFQLTTAQLASLPTEPLPPTVEQTEILANVGEVWDRALPKERREMVNLLVESVAIACDEHQLAELNSGKRQRMHGASFVKDIVIRPRFRDLVTLGLAYTRQERSRCLDLSYPAYRDDLEAMDTWLRRKRAA